MQTGCLSSIKLWQTYFSFTFGHHFTQNGLVLSGAFGNLPCAIFILPILYFPVQCCSCQNHTLMLAWNNYPGLCRTGLAIVYVSEQSWAMLKIQSCLFLSKQQTKFLSAGFMALKINRSRKHVWRAGCMHSTCKVWKEVRMRCRKKKTIKDPS